MSTTSPSGYEALGGVYDAYTAHPRYPDWIRDLEREARRHGLGGRRLLDLGCGTGNSFLPLCELGYEITGVDLTDSMLAQAERKSGGRARLLRADISELAVLGSFDLVFAINDVANCLLDQEALAGLFAGAAANLAPGGVFVFDLNTLASFRGVFATTHCRETDDELFVWQGRSDGAFQPGDITSARFDAFVRAGDCWQRSSSLHLQRHHPRDEVLASLAMAGLEPVTSYGQDSLGRPQGPLDELRHPKAIYLARRCP